MRATFLALLCLATLTGCFVPAPESCHQKWIRSHPNREEYDFCMVRYRVEQNQAPSFEDRERYEAWRQDRRARAFASLSEEGTALYWANRRHRELIDAIETSPRPPIPCTTAANGETTCTSGSDQPPSPTEQATLREATPDAAQQSLLVLCVVFPDGTKACARDQGKDRYLRLPTGQLVQADRTQQVYRDAQGDLEYGDEEALGSEYVATCYHYQDGSRVHLVPSGHALLERADGTSVRAVRLAACFADNNTGARHCREMVLESPSPTAETVVTAPLAPASHHRESDRVQ